MSDSSTSGSNSTSTSISQSPEPVPSDESSERTLFEGHVATIDEEGNEEANPSEIIGYSVYTGDFGSFPHVSLDSPPEFSDRRNMYVDDAFERIVGEHF